MVSVAAGYLDSYGMQQHFPHRQMMEVRMAPRPVLAQTSGIHYLPLYGLVTGLSRAYVCVTGRPALHKTPSASRMERASFSRVFDSERYEMGQKGDLYCSG